MPVVTLHTQFMALAVLFPAVFILTGFLALIAPYLGRSGARTVPAHAPKAPAAKAQRARELAG